MADGKKISFGFKALPKKVAIVSSKVESKNEDPVQYIDCIEEKSIKVKNEEPKKPDFLVIPLQKTNSGAIISRNSELINKIINKSSIETNSDVVLNSCKTVTSVCSGSENKSQTLDEIAAKEIIEDLNKAKIKAEEQDQLSVPLTSVAPVGEIESTIEDYESIPVEKFGLAMLRGMGWLPGRGIGKNVKLVAAKQPVLRPKGLGLGADKVIQKEVPQITLNNEPIKLVKGSFIRVIAGIHKDSYGEIIGFDEETGRLIVKMALNNSVQTFNEFMVAVISKEDYNKNSKVINFKKYEEYKRNDNKQAKYEDDDDNDEEKEGSGRSASKHKRYESSSSKNKRYSEERSDRKQKYEDCGRSDNKHKNYNDYGSKYKKYNYDDGSSNRKHKMYEEDERDDSKHKKYKEYDRYESKHKKYDKYEKSDSKHRKYEDDERNKHKKHKKSRRDER